MEFVNDTSLGYHYNIQKSKGEKEVELDTTRMILHWDTIIIYRNLRVKRKSNLIPLERVSCLFRTHYLR
jgi:hypothetical protein